MKKNSTMMRNDLLAMSDSELNRVVSIKDTDYNRNVKYGTMTKKNWKRLYEAENLGMTIQDIADAYGASYSTVRKVVDPEYREKSREAKKMYNKTYHESHPEKQISTPEYRKELITRKRRIISSENLAHLKAL